VSTAKTLGLQDWRAQVFVLAVLAFAGLSSGAWFLGTGIATVARSSDILANGEHSLAQVISIDESVPDPVGAPDDIFLTTTVSFVTAAGDEVDAVLPAGGVQPDYEVGDQVEVVYHRGDATSVVLNNDSVIAGQSVAIWIGAVILALSLIPVLVGVRVVRKGRIMRA
jgi:hypothetical protein